MVLEIIEFYTKQMDMTNQLIGNHYHEYNENNLTKDHYFCRKTLKTQHNEFESYLITKYVLSRLNKYYRNVIHTNLWF